MWSSKPGAWRIIATVTLACATCVVPACSGDGTGPEPPLFTDGTFQNSVPGRRQTTIDFRPDGSFSMVVADYDLRTCDPAAGSWELKGDVLRLTYTSMAGSEVYSAVEVTVVMVDDELHVTDDDGFTFVYVPVTEMVGCTRYGFFAGSVWIDGWKLESLAIDVRDEFGNPGSIGDGARDGSIGITAYRDGCPACPRVQLRLETDAPPLTPGRYDIGAPGGSPLPYRLEFRYEPQASSPDYYSAGAGGGSGWLRIERLDEAGIEGAFAFTVLAPGLPEGVLTLDGTLSVEMR